jgi:hypothetical protein
MTTVVFALFLLVTALACGAGQVFATRQIYSATTGTAVEFYDSAADKILKDDVWAFYPDGTYKANLIIAGVRLTRSGKYEANEGTIDLDVSYEGDKYIYADRLFENKESSQIIWHRPDGDFVYYRAP